MKSSLERVLNKVSKNISTVASTLLVTAYLGCSALSCTAAQDPMYAVLPDAEEPRMDACLHRFRVPENMTVSVRPYVQAPESEGEYFHEVTFSADKTCNLSDRAKSVELYLEPHTIKAVFEADTSFGFYENDDSDSCKTYVAFCRGLL